MQFISGTLRSYEEHAWGCLSQLGLVSLESVRESEMSLSFVSKSIQTTTEDGSFVEKPVEGSTDDGGGTGASAGDHRPLFEQLRQNQEQRDAEEEEYQRSMMRGTLALDEEDEAHLISLRRQRERAEMELRQRTDQEMAAFRAARLDRFSTAAAANPPRHDDEDDGGDILDVASKGDETKGSSSASSLLPTRSVTAASSAAVKPSSLPVLIRRRKRGSSEVDAKSGSGASETTDIDQKNARSGKEDGDLSGIHDGSGNSKLDDSTTPPNANGSSEAGGGIGGLLAGYDSSSDEET